MVQVYEFEQWVGAADLQQMVLRLNSQRPRYIRYNSTDISILDTPRALAVDEEDDTVLGESRSLVCQCCSIN